MSSNDRAISGVIAITLTMIVTGIGATVVCAVCKVPLTTDFGVKEVTLSLGGGLVGFLTGVGYAAVQQLKKPDAPSVEAVTKE